MDDGGTANGGVDTDTTSRTITFNVADVRETISGGDRGELLRGTSDNDALHGRGGDDRLKGLAGDDILRSDKGNDRLWGGAGADTFVYATGGGKDLIMDFETGTDRIDLRKWAAIDDFAAVKSHASDRGGNLWIADGHDVLIIHDFSRNQLHAHDFVF